MLCGGPRRTGADGQTGDREGRAAADGTPGRLSCPRSPSKASAALGPKRTLELEPTAGLTLVVGRNGSGKSSFAEGIEILLTGTNSRWARRSRIWKEGWRNLHHARTHRRRSRVSSSTARRARSTLTARMGRPTATWTTARSSRAAADKTEDRPRRASAGRAPSRRSGRSSPTTSWGRRSTKARRSSTTGCRGSSGSVRSRMRSNSWAGSPGTVGHRRRREGQTGRRRSTSSSRCPTHAPRPRERAQGSAMGPGCSGTCAGEPRPTTT